MLQYHAITGIIRFINICVIYLCIDNNWIQKNFQISLDSNQI